ncbi:MAG TPA: TetR/AcrR family transcriptional regulator [Solirubrobacteraceae bacterium]|nr:TetR/AcrR family transcriptional regulator [Solirubrobacteraceae bacterium]
MSDIQRSRLIAATVAAVEESGYAQATVGKITARARVSRRTFYELFDDRDECLAAVLEEAVELVRAELTAAELGPLAWRERVRVGLAAILGFFDREPALARVCVVHALRAGPVVLARREEVIAQLTAALDEGRLQGARGETCTPLTAEGLVGAGCAIVYARLERREREPLSGLLGELMGMIALAYLGPAAARRERALSAPPRPAVTGELPAAESRAASDPLSGVSMRLTYRTARVLEAIATLGGGGEHPSNREVATYAEVADPGQISKLLRRLERLGLLANLGAGHARGGPNAWTLTPAGEHVAQSMRMYNPHQREVA